MNANTMTQREFFDLPGQMREPSEAEFQQDMADRQVIIARLMAADPGMPYITAIVLAGDELGLERSKRWVGEGLHVLDAAPFVGSYHRLNFYRWAHEQGYLGRAHLIQHLIEGWSGSDPDDTDPYWLNLWKEARTEFGGDLRFNYIRDGKPLPHKGVYITVYRGQMTSDPAGCAWTLDETVARKFALTGGGRAVRAGGVVIKGEVHMSNVLAYLTERGESEVICDPKDVR